jgi:hypothetical protein
MVEDGVEPESHEESQERVEPLERRRHIVPLVHQAVAWVSALFKPVIEYPQIPVPQKELGVYLCEKPDLAGKCLFVRGKAPDLALHFDSGPWSVVSVGAGSLYKKTLANPPQSDDRTFPASQRTQVNRLQWAPRAAAKR